MSREDNEEFIDLMFSQIIATFMTKRLGENLCFSLKISGTKPFLQRFVLGLGSRLEEEEKWRRILPRLRACREWSLIYFVKWFSEKTKHLTKGKCWETLRWIKKPNINLDDATWKLSAHTSVREGRASTIMLFLPIRFLFISVNVFENIW